MSTTGAESLVQQGDETDFIVVGSGGAGLGAAVSAAHLGNRVVVLEQSSFIGGTTAFSGALLWAPLHAKRTADDPADSRERAIEYVLRNSGDCDRSLVEAYVDSAAEALSFLESVTPLRLISLAYPDTFPEAPGGVTRGRYVEPALQSLRITGTWRDRIRNSPHPQPMTGGEIAQIGMFANMGKAVRGMLPKIIWRMLRAQRGGGQALVASLLRGALDHGVRFQLECRATTLHRDATGHITGVDCEHQGKRIRLTAKKAVILACGGYEWSKRDVYEHIGAVFEHLPTPPLAAGDNLRLAVSAGAQLGRLGEVWHWPTGYIPGTSYEGEPLGRLVLTERSMPHSLVVNRHGRRFGNEAAHNFALTMLARDSSGAPINAPAWAVFDQRHREHYPVLLKIMPGKPAPEWLTSASTLEELAGKSGIDAEGLTEAVARFNTFARSGRDADFNRGDTAYDRYFGDPASAGNPCLGTVEQPPFYALRMYPSAVGTRGGPLITADAQAMDASGMPIPGLYAAGNASACFHGPTMIAGGTTVMAGLVFGRRAVLHACRPTPSIYS